MSVLKGKSVKIVIFAALAVALAVGAWLLIPQETVEEGGSGGARLVKTVSADGTPPAREKGRDPSAETAGEGRDEEGRDPSDAEVEDGAAGGESSPGELAAEAEEKLVEEFDGAVDAWVGESAKTPPSMADVDAFVAKFKRVPAKRREECLQRALNLIPDDNVMLLAGVLMDRGIDREYVELVYNDVLNRSEEVKGTILQEIFKDRTHPCWADTAWILDATGALPGKNGGDVDSEAQ